MLIAEFHQVLTVSECKFLINHVKDNLQTLTVIGSNAGKYRNGDGTWIYNDLIMPDGTNITSKIKGIVEEWTGLPKENQENIHIVHYGVGGEYKEHHDFFHANGSDYYQHIKNAGQRIYTCLFYLNDDFQGGDTRFVKKNMNIKPATGKLLVWSNMKDDGMFLDYDSLHAGLPVISGEKWIALVWVRQSKFSK